VADLLRKVPGPLRQFSLAVLDAALVNLGVVASLWIRFEGNVPLPYLSNYAWAAAPFTLLTLAVFRFSGLYTSLWRYAGIGEALTLVKATFLSGVALVLVVFVGGLPLPRSVYLLSWLVNSLLIAGSRFSLRIVRHLAHEMIVPERQPSAAPRRVLIMGAGEAGAMVLREMTAHPELGFVVAGMIDDDRRKLGMRIRGARVLGARRDIRRLVKEHRVDEVIIAIPSAPGSLLREVTAACHTAGVRVRTLPGVFELIGDRVKLGQIRDIQIEDLLGREPVELDAGEVSGYLRGRTVMVTGAGGSIGSELCRQVARLSPEALVMLDHDENGSFEAALGLDMRFPGLKKHVIIADIRDERKIDLVFGLYHPAVVFHAAAHKHVPLMEMHPDEAVKTNILGTINAAMAAQRHGTAKFVFISTDKAVNPTSVMGATKRAAEMAVLSLNGGSLLERGAGRVVDRRTLAEVAAAGEPTPLEATRFVVVRFGNVLGSRGSVVPVFKTQIAAGGPVTVTHSEMRRYFMTTPEAVQLVIQAGALGQGGEVFVLDMGEPIKIIDLARNMIRLCGYEPDRDIRIEFTGLRPGEKLFEELLTVEEKLLATKHKLIYQVPPGCPTPGGILEVIRELGEAAGQWPSGAVVDRLRELVPEFSVRPIPHPSREGTPTTVVQSDSIGAEAGEQDRRVRT
jgi:FlaA1/EpsC-like NDP-sugar epimerase